MDTYHPVNSRDTADIKREIEQLIQAFEGHRGASPNEMTRLQALMEIFHRCGLATRRDVPLDLNGRTWEVDGDFEIDIEGVKRRIAVEVKLGFRLDMFAKAIEQARRIRAAGRYDRALVVVAGKVPETERRRAETEGVGYIDLLGIPELRSWLWKHVPALQLRAGEPTCAQIIREAMRAIAERLARAPDEIATIEWRDLERVLREIFEGMGFETILTRGGKDGGFDLELSTEGDTGRETYLVEVKHWADQKPGKSHLRKLFRVTAKEKARKGILLSSSGFAPSIYEGFTEAERSTVALGGRDKIVGLCKTYYRLGGQLWCPDTSISVQLLDGLH